MPLIQSYFVVRLRAQNEVFKKFHLAYVIMNTTKNFLVMPPCEKKVIFVAEFVFLDQDPHFYEVNQ